MRKTAAVAALLFIFLCYEIFPGVVPALAATESGADTAAVAGNLDFSAVEKYIDDMDGDTKEILGATTLNELWQQAKNGEISLKPAQMGKALLRLFWNELLASGKILAQLAVLAAACLILTNLRGAMASEAVSTLSHGVVYLALLGIALQSFTLAGGSAKEAVETMSGFLYSLTPLLLTILAAMGGVVSINIFQPILLFLVGAAVNIIQVVVLPLVYFGAILGIVSYISPRFNVNKLAKLCRDVALGIMTLMLTLFTAAMGLTGLAGSVMDGLTVKAAKAASGIFIPVVGKSLADALDTVLSTALILKNSIGIFGVIALFLICALPAVKVLVMALIYRLAAAFVEPLGDGELSNALNGLGSSLTALFGVVAASGLLFFFVLSIIVGMGNISMMIR